MLSSTLSPRTMGGHWPHPGCRAGTIYGHPTALISPHQLAKPGLVQHPARIHLSRNADILGRSDLQTYIQYLFQAASASSFRIQTSLKKADILIYSPISGADDAGSSSRARKLCPVQGLEWHQVVVHGFLFVCFFCLEVNAKNIRKVVQISAILKDFKSESMPEYAFCTYICTQTLSLSTDSANI